MRSWDAIIIGAGLNGLVVSIRLARAGLSVLVVEHREEVGGMARSEEPLLPGFVCNPHANLLSYADISPVFKEFNLHGAGLRTVMPEAQHGICFEDARPPIVIYDRKRRDLTRRSISEYSKHDADLFDALHARSDELDGLIRRGIFAPAHRDWFLQQRMVAGSIARALGVSGGLETITAFDVIQDLFESDEMRMLLIQACAEFGVEVEQTGGALSLLTLIPWIVGQWHLPIGGMQQVPKALKKVATEAGVEFLTGAKVSKIVVKLGRARGVFVRGHGTLKANQVVASTVGAAETLLRLVESGSIPKEAARNVRSFEATPTGALASMFFCLREAPDYASARWNSDINKCFHTLVGFSSSEQALQQLSSSSRTGLDAPCAAVRVNSLWDAAQSPTGYHSASADVLLPDHSNFSAQQLIEIRASYMDQFVAVWRKHAPNINEDSLLAREFWFEPYERKMLFGLGTDNYRSPVRGLYLCGVSTYPGGGAHGACGYNGYLAMAEDMGLTIGSDT